MTQAQGALSARRADGSPRDQIPQAPQIIDPIDIEPSIEHRDTHSLLPKASHRLRKNARAAPGDILEQPARAAGQTQQVESAILGWPDRRVRAVAQFRSRAGKKACGQAGRVGSNRDRLRVAAKRPSEDPLESISQISFPLKPYFRSRRAEGRRKPAGACENRTRPAKQAHRSPGIQQKLMRKVRGMLGAERLSQAGLHLSGKGRLCENADAASSV